MSLAFSMGQQEHSYHYFLDRINSVNDQNFEELALELFRYQVTKNPVYHKYTGYLDIQPGNITSLEQIPFIPVEFFKRHAVKTGRWKPETHFLSSGTTGSSPSRHPVRNIQVYLENTLRIFRSFYGDPGEYHIFALLPSYLERQGSSLITMVEHLMQLSESPLGGFYLYEYEKLLQAITQARKDRDRNLLLIGVTFGLIDMAERHAADLSDVLIMETGGMKGRRTEMTREEVHQVFVERFNARAIHSEYGMTELFSQAYSSGNGIYRRSAPMKVLLRDPFDPLDVSADRRRGAINIIDLANVHSCAFIATDDLGILDSADEFRVTGRLDNSDIRGCNLMLG